MEYNGNNMVNGYLVNEEVMKIDEFGALDPTLAIEVVVMRKFF